MQTDDNKSPNYCLTRTSLWRWRDLSIFGLQRLACSLVRLLKEELRKCSECLPRNSWCFVRILQSRTRHSSCLEDLALIDSSTCKTDELNINLFQFNFLYSPKIFHDSTERISDCLRGNQWRTHRISHNITKDIIDSLKKVVTYEIHVAVCRHSHLKFENLATQ